MEMEQSARQKTNSSPEFDTVRNIAVRPRRPCFTGASPRPEHGRVHSDRCSVHPFGNCICREDDTDSPAHTALVQAIHLLEPRVCQEFRFGIDQQIDDGPELVAGSFLRSDIVLPDTLQFSARGFLASRVERLRPLKLCNIFLMSRTPLLVRKGDRHT